MKCENRLEFREGKDVLKKVFYKIYNKDNQYLGNIRKNRVGKFMHWCFFPDDVNVYEESWFTNGCLKEITSFITSLYKKDRDKGITSGDNETI